METYLDFKKVSIYKTYIYNIKWVINFMKDKIMATTDENYTIYEARVLSKDVINYNSYRECFDDIINEIKMLRLCNTCKRLDMNGCKICKLDNIIDELCKDVKIENECPICFNDIIVRYVNICNDDRHSICVNCYYNLLRKTCPICRIGENEESI